MLIAWLIFPLALLALCAGLGLLVDVISGRRLPGALIPAVGIAALVVVGQVTTLSDATAEATVPFLVVLALLGVGLSLPWRFGRPDPLPALAAVAVFAVFGAPVILAGEPTFLGYVKLDDTATWLALTDQVMHHGHDLSYLEPSSYAATLRSYSGGYPVGTLLPLGTGSELVGGTDVAWLFQPYEAFLAAMLSLAVWELAGGLLERSRLRALVAFVAAQPALLFGYTLWGGVKEIGAAALVALAAALAPAVLRPDAGPRDVVPLAIACAALAAELSIGGLVWVTPMLLVLAVIVWRGRGAAEALRVALPFALMLGLLAIPVVVNGLSPAVADPLTSNALGNLIAPLNDLQAVGIWPTGDFRLAPEAVPLSALLIATAIAAASIGAALAWRRGGTAILLYATSLVACCAIVAAGSPWNAAKALATVSPAVLLLAMAGAAAAISVEKLSVVLLVVVTGGVLWSNALAYHDVSPAPYQQLSELRSIGDEIAGQGPTLMTEYQPYGVRHFLRAADPEGVSELRARPILRRDGTEVEKGKWEDTDGLSLSELLVYRTLVLRRSPAQSRPPSDYRLTRRGEYYDVWQRPPGRTRPIAEHLSLGDFEDPAGVPGCGEVLRLAGVAGPGGRLAAVERRAPISVPLDGPEVSVQVPAAGRYEAFVLGSATNPVTLKVDGKEVGSVEFQRNPDAQFLHFGEARLTAGGHRVSVSVAGQSAAPGSGAPVSMTGPLVLAPVEPLKVTYVPPARARELCGRHLDWIEAIPG